MGGEHYARYYSHDTTVHAPRYLRLCHALWGRLRLRTKLEHMGDATGPDDRSLAEGL